jgi:chitin disaccharide deacetylase
MGRGVKRLIVTADDFGVAQEVNEAVEAAHRNGILTAASLMVSGAASADAVARARRLPRLRVGLHLVLTDGRPVLPPESVSHLVEPSGLFRTDLAGLGATIAFNRQARTELIAEITAQFEAFAATGLKLDHCNAHLHFHLHPLVGRLLATIGARFGLRAVRVPLEPVQVLRRIEPDTPRASGLGTAPFALWLRRVCRAAGYLTPERVFGLRWSGQMTRQRLAALIAALPDGLSEIYLHPATGAYPGSAPGYRYSEELAALTDPEVRAACRDGSIELGAFTDFLQITPPSEAVQLRAQREVP